MSFIYKPESVVIVPIGINGQTSFHVNYIAEGMYILSQEEIDEILSTVLLLKYPDLVLDSNIYNIDYANKPDIDGIGRYHNACTIQAYVRKAVVFPPKHQGKFKK